MDWDEAMGGTQIEVLALTTSAPVLAQRGALDEAERRAELFVPRAREIGDPQTLAPALIAGATIHALAGRMEEAMALVAEFEESTRERPNFRRVRLASALRVCALTGELELATTLEQGAEGSAAGLFTVTSAVAARAIVAEIAGKADEAEVAYREAAERWEEWGSLVERAYALLGLGRLGDATAGREGLAFFEQRGAVPLPALAA